MAATSDGLPQRPRGVRASAAAGMSGDMGSVMGVSMKPGQMAFTRISREARQPSSAKRRAMARPIPEPAPVISAMRSLSFMRFLGEYLGVTLSRGSRAAV